MRSLVLALAVSLIASPLLAQSAGTTTALEKLEWLRKQRKELAIRNRCAILFTNDSNVPGAEQALAEQTAVLFSSKGHEIINQADANAAAAAHAKGTPWTPEELAAIAENLRAETVVVGNLKEYRAHREFGAPLPTMWVRTDAHVTVEGWVFRKTQGQVVWQNTVSRKERNLIGGGVVKRHEARARTGLNSVDQLYNGYLNKRS
jgi:hypothetical protein